mgnify:CR=1 FL=1
MVQEIIYTSAQAGLKKGSRGFCTVVSTAGMGANLAERLESMSGYRHAFALHDPNVGLNPINYAHVITRLAGQKLNVLSRVADAGQDYSGRTNKLAHHIVIDDLTALPSGPARVLADDTAFVRDWDGTVATRPPRNLVNPKTPETIQLSAWKTAAGDEGWAGFVAEKLLKSRAPIHVIFSAGTDTLALLMDVLDLIPAPSRWTVTFSTYFTRLQAGTECQLRFLLDGTNESTSLRNDARAEIVDLAATLPPATGGALVEAARRGGVHPNLTSPAPAKTASVRTTATQKVSDDELESLLDSDGIPSDQTSPSRGPGKPRGPAAPPGSPPPKSRLDAAFQQRSSGGGTWLIAAVAVLLLLGGGGLAIWAAFKNSATRNPVADSSETTPSDWNAESVEAPPAPKPFDGQNPFARVEEGAITWTLPPLKNDAKSPNLTILVRDTADFRISSKIDGLDVAAAVVDNDGSATWAVNCKGKEISKFHLAAPSDSEGTTLSWSWSEGGISDDELRKATYALQDAQFTLQAKVNDGTEQHQERSLQLKIDKLFEGETPFAKIAIAKDTSSFDWDVTEAVNVPLQILAWSPRNLVKVTSDTTGVELLEIPGTDSTDWQVSVDGTRIGSFVATKSATGLDLSWKWENGATLTTVPSDAAFRLSKMNFQLRAEREDGEKATLPLHFKIAAPDVFAETEPNFDGQWLLPLPNPKSNAKLATAEQPTLRLWDQQIVELRLHSDFSKLIKTPGRKLQLQANTSPVGPPLSWTATLIETGQPPYELAHYTLMPIDDGAAYRLQFQWHHNFSNRSDSDVAVAELLRWCPLILAVGTEQRLYLQRQPDSWLIPPWDRQKGFALEQNMNEDPNRTGQEFGDLSLSAGDDAEFTLAYSFPLDGDAVTKTFSVPLPPVLDNEDAQSESSNKKPAAPIHHIAWFPLGDITDTNDSDLPDLSEEIGIFDTVIRLPAGRSDNPTFQLATNTWVQFDLPQFSKLPSPPERLRKPENTEKVILSHGELSDQWYRSGPFDQGSMGPVSLLQAKDALKDQSETLQSIANKFKKQATDRLKSLRRRFADTAVARQQVAELERTQPDKMKQERQDFASLPGFLNDANDLLQKHPEDGPFKAAAEKAERLTEQLEGVTMQLQLAKTLKGNKTDPEITIVFIDAQMAPPQATEQVDPTSETGAPQLDPK